MPGAYASSTLIVFSSSCARAASVLAAASYGAYWTTADSTCLPARRERAVMHRGYVDLERRVRRDLAVLRGIEGMLQVDQIRGDDEAFSRECCGQPRELGQAVEREMQLGRHALGAEVPHAMHEAGLEMPSAEQLEQRALGIRVADDHVRLAAFHRSPARHRRHDRR
jgi:hypothetical protein